MLFSLATDHAGFEHKEAIKEFLQERGHEVTDFGCHSAESCDYPDFVRPAAQAVADGRVEAAIVFGGSGNGEAMCANKVKRVRCALCWNTDTGRLAKEHNNANALSFGARQISVAETKAIILAWLEAEFGGGRHLRRVEKLEI